MLPSARQAFCALAFLSLIGNGTASADPLLKNVGHVRDAQGVELTRFATEGLGPKACLEALTAVALATPPKDGIVYLEGVCVDLSQSTPLGECIYQAQLTGKDLGCAPNASYRPIELYAGIEPRCTVTVADRQDLLLQQVAAKKATTPLTAAEQQALESFFQRRCTISVGVSTP